MTGADETCQLCGRAARDLYVFGSSAPVDVRGALVERLVACVECFAEARALFYFPPERGASEP